MRVLFSALLLCLLSASAIAENYSGQMEFTYGSHKTVIKDLPAFKDFPAAPAPRKFAKDIDFTSGNEARKYRTRLRWALKEGANFNGHYNVTVFGCGSGCQISKIVDIETGRVIDGWTTSNGVIFHKDSALIVPELPEEQNPDWQSYCMLDQNPPRFYVMKQNRLVLLKTMNLDAVWKPYSGGPCADPRADPQ